MGPHRKRTRRRRRRRVWGPSLESAVIIVSVWEGKERAGLLSSREERKGALETGRE